MIHFPLNSTTITKTFTNIEIKRCESFTKRKKMLNSLRDLANNSLNYIQTQMTVPLRIRKSGRSIEEVRNDLKEELKSTNSREKDAERQISQHEKHLRETVSKRQELALRIQNLDENRQFLIQQANETEW